AAGGVPGCGLPDWGLPACALLACVLPADDWEGDFCIDTALTSFNNGMGGSASTGALHATTSRMQPGCGALKRRAYSRVPASARAPGSARVVRPEPAGLSSRRG